MNEKLIPESLREVWRWKEEIAREDEGLSRAEVVRKMNEFARQVQRERGVVLPRFTPSRRTPK